MENADGMGYLTMARFGLRLRNDRLLPRWRLGIKKQAVAGLESELFATQQVEQFVSVMLKRREYIGFDGQGSQAGFDHDTRTRRSDLVQQVELMPHPVRVTLDLRPEETRRAASICRITALL